MQPKSPDTVHVGLHAGGPSRFAALLQPRPTPRLSPSIVAEVRASADRGKLELQASEEAREALERRLAELEAKQDAAQRLALNLHCKYFCVVKNTNVKLG
mmetsp:Transcript_30679/g.94914  ORF Transcript_30679/g.94914 Transcript_30679/m.94914 type:complete len:100 (-) Transcript_30679:2593-2892(-)